MRPKSLSVLKREKERIEKEGFLTGCRIVTYRPSGTARGQHVYYQLRSKEPFENGKRNRHLKGEEEIRHARRLIANAKKLKEIERHIAYLESGKQSRRASLTSSASEEWYSPPWVIDLARQVMGGIDCDPASNAIAQQWIQAATWYGIKDDGLKQRWHGRTWLNPPYGGQIGQWTGKAIEAYESGDIEQAILLVRPAPGSAWFQQLAAKCASCVTDKRIRFIDANGVEQASPVHGNIFYFIGQEVERFREVFSEIGVVARPW